VTSEEIKEVTSERLKELLRQDTVLSESETSYPTDTRKVWLRDWRALLASAAKMDSLRREIEYMKKLITMFFENHADNCECASCSLLREASSKGE